MYGMLSIYTYLRDTALEAVLKTRGLTIHAFAYFSLESYYSVNSYNNRQHALFER